MRYLVGLFWIFLLVSCNNNVVADNKGDSIVGVDPIVVSEFNLPILHNQRAGNDLWATYYYMPRFRAVNGGQPLLDQYGRSFEVELTEHDWCFGALEGSFQVETLDNRIMTFNFIKSTGYYQVDCSAYFNVDVGHSRFMLAKGVFGDGVNGYKLVPYRSIAVDPNFIPIGSVIYIPEARGTRIELPDGKIVEHDGYFIAVDRGSRIQGAHIDVFLGITHRNPFDWIRNRPGYKVRFFMVRDRNIIDYLRKQHR